jgi:CheY-like chemotaxis protein
MYAEMILIVDDNRRMRETLRDLLSGYDPDCRECESGREAVDLYRRHRPAWVVMDVKMGGMDGIAATREIVGEFPGARIIIVTNYDDPLLRQQAGEAGAAGFVLKDDLSVLHRIITGNE